MTCPKCGGLCYTSTDHYGAFQACWNCGWSGDLTIELVLDLWREARASEGPGGPRGDVLNLPYGRRLRRG